MTKQKVKFKKFYWIIYNEYFGLYREHYDTKKEAVKELRTINERVIKVQIKEII